MFNWGGLNSILPGQIWCFVVINSRSDTDEDLLHGGIIVENGHYVPSLRTRDRIANDTIASSKSHCYELHCKLSIKKLCS
jgi:hypothetical protein